MKKPASPPHPTRAIYAVLLAAVTLLLWFLAQPKPGLRITTLKPVLAQHADKRSPKKQIRVATFNLEHFTDARNDGPERTPELYIAQAQGAAEIIQEADPDVLLLQEIENGRTLEFLNSQLDTPYPFIYVTRLQRSSGDLEKLNLGMLSRLPPSKVRQLAFHQLDGAGRPSRGSLAAEFRLGQDSRLLVYNIHLKSNYGKAPRNQAKRARALHQIADDAVSRQYRNHPALTSVVILGDTNVDPDTPAFADDPSLQPLGGGYADLWIGRPLEERITIPTREAGELGDPMMVFPPSAFDRIFVSLDLTDGRSRWKAQQPETLQKGVNTRNNLTKPGVDGHITDHHLVYVDLKR
jgi:endonuclease/exonuclease/phosphatase family metal-dependent hydrolase